MIVGGLWYFLLWCIRVNYCHNMDSGFLFLFFLFDFICLKVVFLYDYVCFCAIFVA